MIPTIRLKHLARQTQWILFWGIFASVIAFYITWDQQQRIWQEELQQEVLENTLILGGKLEVVERELLGVLSLFNSSEFVSREEFKTYVQPILGTNPYIQSISWIPRISNQSRQVFEENLAALGFRSFRINERKKDNSLSSADFRLEYYPVFYTEPLENNKLVLGFDMASIPSLKKVMDEARDSGKAMATEKVEFLYGKNKIKGIFVFAPFYETRSIPSSVFDRREKLVGFIAGFYRFNEMMDQMVAPYQAKGIHLTIFDGDTADDNHKLYGELIPSARREIKNLLNFSGRNWFLVWQETADFQKGPRTVYAWWTGGSILLLALFLAIIFEMMASRTRQVEEEVRLRTEELTQANERLRLEIEARKKAEKALQAAKEEAETASKAKSAFLANMSHEIRTPMNAILGYAQILSRNPHIDPAQKKNISNILQSGDHLLQLINDILDISKIEAGKMELKTTDFDLNAVLNGISTMVQPRCEEKNITWQVEGLKNVPIWVHGDEVKLKQVLLNLIGNAIKFVESGKITLKVTPKDLSTYLFEVLDTGRGISKEKQENIFEPFYQESYADSKGGAGLGLAIVKKQIELMRGTLSLDSAPGKGSRFSFSLPLPPAQNPEYLQNKGRTTSYHLHPGTHIKALVADDNPQNREILAEILKSSGIEVITAVNGEEAIEQTRQNVPDIIFMDLRMPGTDGVEALQIIRKELPGDQIKIVAISASAFEHQRESTLRAGFDDFIPKPFKVDKIFTCLENLLNVKFSQYSDESDAPVPKEETQTDFLTIPQGLMDRLTNAVHLSNITDLKRCLCELENQGPEGSILSNRIRPLAQKYDMHSIKELLEKITNGKNYP